MAGPKLISLANKIGRLVTGQQGGKMAALPMLVAGIRFHALSEVRAGQWLREYDAEVGADSSFMDATLEKFVQEIEPSSEYQSGKETE